MGFFDFVSAKYSEYSLMGTVHWTIKLMVICVYWGQNDKENIKKVSSLVHYALYINPVE